jgi:hypothetical protein
MGYGTVCSNRDASSFFIEKINLSRMIYVTINIIPLNIENIVLKIMGGNVSAGGKISKGHGYRVMKIDENSLGSEASN